MVHQPSNSGASDVTDRRSGRHCDNHGAVAAHDVHGVLARSREAKALWAQLRVSIRCSYLAKALEELDAVRDELAAVISRETGKASSSARGEVTRTIDVITSSLPEYPRAFRRSLVTDGQLHSVVEYRPYGVCAVITPWNYPCLIPARLIVPALAGGNVVIAKPSERSPESTTRFVDALRRSLPTGVLQVAHGDGTTARQLIEAGVNLVAFTGSLKAGRAVLQAATASFTRVILETGGNNAMLVLEGADVDAAAGLAKECAFRNLGQTCTRIQRIYIHTRIFDSFVGRFAKSVRSLGALDTGDDAWLEPDSARRTAELCDDALSRGATVLCQTTTGGGAVVTALRDVPAGSRILDEEAFGPIVCVNRFDTVAEAIRMANDSDYGLAAVVVGRRRQAARVARDLDVGMIGINTRPIGALGTPWAGAKCSGMGFHSSIEGHRQFAQVRVSTSAARPSKD